MRQLLPWAMVLLTSCAFAPMTVEQARSKLDYVNFPGGDYTVSSDKVDTAAYEIGFGVSLNSAIAATVAPHERKVRYNLRLDLSYTAYSALPFYSVRLNGHEYGMHQITTPQVDSCSSNGRCLFNDFYSADITQDDVRAMANAPGPTPIEISVGGRTLSGSISAIEARAILSASNV